MKTKNEGYVAPKSEIIEIQVASVLMASGGGGQPSYSGGTWRGGTVEFDPDVDL
ncbi:MAG: hypothetical protein J6T22_08285 [Bacteroidales bacterium]|nr:hypothetical protein [Bacteroidales bacterium]